MILRQLCLSISLHAQNVKGACFAFLFTDQLTLTALIREHYIALKLQLTFTFLGCCICSGNGMITFVFKSRFIEKAK